MPLVLENKAIEFERRQLRNFSISAVKIIKDLSLEHQRTFKCKTLTIYSIDKLLLLYCCWHFLTNHGPLDEKGKKKIHLHHARFSWLIAIAWTRKEIVTATERSIPSVLLFAQWAPIVHALYQMEIVQQQTATYL